MLWDVATGEERAATEDAAETGSRNSKLMFSVHGRGFKPIRLLRAGRSWGGTSILERGGSPSSS
jgi:hypothetical protein